jgi:hypothetical protein
MMMISLGLEGIFNSFNEVLKINLNYILKILTVKKNSNLKYKNTLQMKKF